MYNSPVRVVRPSGASPPCATSRRTWAVRNSNTPIISVAAKATTPRPKTATDALMPIRLVTCTADPRTISTPANIRGYGLMANATVSAMAGRRHDGWPVDNNARLKPVTITQVKATRSTSSM
ncbi:hypothetical protein D3C80_1471950 [compost metagenome]